MYRKYLRIRGPHKAGERGEDWELISSRLGKSLSRSEYVLQKQIAFTKESFSSMPLDYNQLGKLWSILTNCLFHSGRQFVVPLKFTYFHIHSEHSLHPPPPTPIDACDFWKQSLCRENTCNIPKGFLRNLYY